jgi:hypothetical protein
MGWEGMSGYSKKPRHTEQPTKQLKPEPNQPNGFGNFQFNKKSGMDQTPFLSAFNHFEANPVPTGESLFELFDQQTGRETNTEDVCEDGQIDPDKIKLWDGFETMVFAPLLKPEPKEPTEEQEKLACWEQSQVSIAAMREQVEADKKASLKGEPLPKDFKALADHESLPFLFTDGCRFGKGKSDAQALQDFEANEEGYYEAMRNGFEAMVALTDGHEVDADALELMNLACSLGVKTKMQQEENFEPGVRDGRSNFVPVGSDPKLLPGDMLEAFGMGGALHGFTALKKSAFGDDLSFQTRERKRVEIKEKIDQLLSDYRCKRDGAKTDEDKVEALVQCCRHLDWLHPFLDGNIRTIVFLFMNSELAKLGLSPTIMSNPNDLDSQDLGSVVEEVGKGQDTFKQRFAPPPEGP